MVIVALWLSLLYGYPCSMVRGRPSVEMGQSRHGMNVSCLPRLVFLCSRAGMLEKAKSLCVEMGQPWRAASLIGWELSHDPNLGSRQEEKLPLAGNPRRDLWKKTAWDMSNCTSLTPQERAIYSSLCGNSKQLVTSGVCCSWEDLLWALCKGMVDKLVEEELRRTIPRSYLDMPKEYWENEDKLENVFEALRRLHKNNKSCPYQSIQTFIVLENWPALLECLSTCSDDSNEVNPQLLRFMAHLVMCLKKLVYDLDADNATVAVKDKVLKRHIAFLVNEGRVAQVAWYAAHLQSGQVEVYANFLATVEQREDRELALELGYEHGLPMEEARRLLVHKLLDFSDGDCDDDEKVAAIDWLLYSPTQEADAVRQGCALARYLIAERKPAKAGTVLEKLSPCVAALAEDEVSTSFVKEFHCLTAYVEAKELFEEWFAFYHKARPVKPDTTGITPAGGQERHQYVDMVATEGKSKRYLEELSRWKNSLRLQSENVVNSLEAVLKFPSGWLDCTTSDGESQGLYDGDVRAKELDYLRRTCIVEASLLLHNVLHRTQQFDRAALVADLVASEEFGLYTLFSKDDMSEFLLAVRSSFIEKMEVCGGDPWAVNKVE